jgi:hypothetical protein
MMCNALLGLHEESWRAKDTKEQHDVIVGDSSTLLN